jgi:hypothetical protein
MAVFTKFNSFVSDLAQKVHNLNSDALKIMLSNTAPVATNTVKANIAEITAANGYVAGGNAAAFVSGNQSAGTYKLILSPVLFTAAGGSFGPFEFAVLYNSSTASGNLIAWWDYGTPITITNGNSFTVALDQTNGTLTLA